MCPTQPDSISDVDKTVELGNRAETNSCIQPSVSFSNFNNFSGTSDLETDDATNPIEPYNLSDILEAREKEFDLKEQFYDKQKIDVSFSCSSNSYSSKRITKTNIELGEFTMVSQPIKLILVDWFVF